MHKELTIIITKSIGFDMFWLYLKGHKPNRDFKSCVSVLLPTIGTVFIVVSTMESVLKSMGHSVKTVADSSAIEPVNTYCELMAFEKIEQYRE